MEKNLAAFLAVARAHTLTSACESLGVTQPSATKRIANLEADFGAPLFTRDRNGMTLTQAGRLLLDHAERIEAEYRFSRERVGLVAKAGLTHLRVGAGPLFHLSCAAALFRVLKMEYPDLQLELITDTRRSVAASLLNGDLDLYLGMLDLSPKPSAMFSRDIVEVEHGVVLPRDHPAAQQDVVHLDALPDHPWVIFGNDPLTEARLSHLLGQGDQQPQNRHGVIDIRTTSFATGLQLVLEGPFLMSAPLPLAPRVLSSGLVIRPVADGMPKRRAGLHFRQSSMDYGVIRSVMTFFDSFSF